MQVGDLVMINDKEHNAFGVSFGIVVKMGTPVPLIEELGFSKAALVCWMPEGFEHWWECHRLEVICK
jgi:hypothetical protein